LRGGMIVTQNDRGKRKKEREKKMKGRVSVTDGQIFFADLIVTFTSVLRVSAGVQTGLTHSNNSNPPPKQPPK